MLVFFLPRIHMSCVTAHVPLAVHLLSGQEVIYIRKGYIPVVMINSRQIVWTHIAR